jgi:hypothetical protein
MSDALNKILGRGPSLEAEPSEYRSYIDSGGRPQMGFFIAQVDGTMDGFLYHSLDNIRFQVRNGSDFLTFTHRGTAVTIQGTGLKVMFKAMMRHTLMEIHENDGHESDRKQPQIVRLEVTPADTPSRPVRLAK